MAFGNEGFNGADCGIGERRGMGTNRYSCRNYSSAYRNGNSFLKL